MTKEGWTDDEKMDWNVHTNILGFGLITFCGGKILQRLVGMGMPQKASVVIEIVFVLFVMITGLRMVFARHKKTRDQVPEITNGSKPFFIGAFVAFIYVIGLLFELTDGFAW